MRCNAKAIPFGPSNPTRRTLRPTDTWVNFVSNLTRLKGTKPREWAAERIFWALKVSITTTSTLFSLYKVSESICTNCHSNTKDLFGLLASKGERKLFGKNNFRRPFSLSIDRVQLGGEDGKLTTDCRERA